MWIVTKVRSLPRLINFRGELFASTFTYGTTAFIRLGSSLVLTRLLTPAAYGIFGILLSIVFITELVSDVGIAGLMVRHPQGGEKRFVHAIWTIRLVRSCLNFGALFLAAPLIAYIYKEPVLTGALRIFSFQFLISGLESMSYILAQRDRRARISNYADLLSNAVMTLFVIGAASILKSYLALVYGFLLQRALITISSYFFYREIGVGFAFDRAAFTEQFRFARFVLPSSILTIILTQYDKLVLLKLFNLSLVGIYSIASNMLAPISGIIVHNSRVILYARCSEYFRTNRSTAAARYYSENNRLLTVGVILPAVVAGFSGTFVSVFYDARYVMVGHILMITALGTVIAAFQNASENVLVASGRTHMVLIENIIKLFTVVPGSLLGYYLFGFYGFVWFGSGAAMFLLVYLFYKQHRFGLLNLSNEIRRFVFALVVFFACFAVNRLLLHFIPPGWLHLGLHRSRPA